MNTERVNNKGYIYDNQQADGNQQVHDNQQADDNQQSRWEDIQETVQNESEETNGGGSKDEAPKETEQSEAREEQNPENNYRAQAEEYLLLMKRVQADFDNFRRRTTLERQEASKYCSMRLASSLLPVLDNFERALKATGDDLQSFKEGIELIYRQLQDVLEKEGVKPMEVVGSQFDPNLHEAVMQEESETFGDNEVMEEFQKGYLLAERVLRPAMVKVAKK